jgi:hypothetical protein
MFPPPRSRHRVEALFDRCPQSSRGRISGTLDGPLPSANLFPKVLAAALMMEADSFFKKLDTQINAKASDIFKGEAFGPAGSPNVKK